MKIFPYRSPRHSKYLSLDMQENFSRITTEWHWMLSEILHSTVHSLKLDNWTSVNKHSNYTNKSYVHRHTTKTVFETYTGYH